MTVIAQAVVALVLVGLVSSLVLGGGLWWLSARARSEHRRATLALLGLVLPPLLALALAVSACVPMLAATIGLDASLLQHSHHRFSLHDTLGALPAAVMLLGTACAVWVLARLLLVVRRWVRAVRAAQRLADLGERRSKGLAVVDGPAAPLCFNIESKRGFLVVMCRALFDRLDDAELRAVIAHEHAHRRHGGNVHLLIARLFSRLHIPGIGEGLVRCWRSAVERLCDREAACETREPLGLANAIVVAHALLHDQAATPAALVSLATPSGDIARVERLVALSGETLEPEPAPRSPWPTVAAATACALALFAVVHRALETVLGLLAG